MPPLLEQSLQQFGLVAATGAYVAAVIDWYRVDPYELNAGRRPSLLWAAGSLLLALILVGLVAAWEGPRGLGPILGGMAGPWLLRAFALLFLVQSGGYWAEALARRPFGLDTARWRDWPWPWLGAWLLFMLAWTALLIVAVKHRQNIPDLFGPAGLKGMPPLLQWPFVIGILTLAPIFEECLFRHYILYRIAALFPERHRRAGVALAIVLASAAWSAAHHGLLEPYWLKMAQTLVLGLILGATAWRHGLAAAIALHWAFNMGLIPLILWLSRP